ncbi:16S rRNA (uracil(1498)-N(3))-methyltransferase [Haliangium ochraceum]|uniref:Ribosomal RNA small subunit methyltransferase E n=1 Tax=Haliangium ochraceum (strain DSM 14365 / JCM 11303 / SMP-2) TaxID=502025 RepID=D0LGJ2_HALO1|nr:16S rRNA (uracil(1498)-N(3))-methyltransferase [Haliangium ochraceum]ACY12738.1 protein of unknown function DUF558 [Haliangium ochraceum DSM 14365]
MSSRLFVEPASLRAGAVEVCGDDHRYLFRVRRLRVGDAVTLFDGAGREADARVAAIDGERAQLEVAEPRAVVAPSPCRVSVLPALIKGDRMDFCVQKLVELGVHEIAPVTSARTVVKLDGARAARRRERFVDIARAAARQCERATVPEIAAIAPLEQALASRAQTPLKLILWARERSRMLRDIVAQPLPAGVCVAVGPEGGFAPEEIEAAVAAGFEPVGLGGHVLRAETASLAAAALLMLAAPLPAAAAI